MACWYIKNNRKYLFTGYSEGIPAKEIAEQLCNETIRLDQMGVKWRHFSWDKNEKGYNTGFDTKALSTLFKQCSDLDNDFSESQITKLLEPMLRCINKKEFHKYSETEFNFNSVEELFNFEIEPSTLFRPVEDDDVIKTLFKKRADL